MTWLGSGLMRGFIFISSCSLLGSTLSPTSSWPLSHSALSSDHDWCFSYPTLPKSYWQTVRCWDHVTIRPLGVEGSGFSCSKPYSGYLVYSMAQYTIYWHSPYLLNAWGVTEGAHTLFTVPSTVSDCPPPSPANLNSCSAIRFRHILLQWPSQINPQSSDEIFLLCEPTMPFQRFLIAFIIPLCNSLFPGPSPSPTGLWVSKGGDFHWIIPVFLTFRALLQDALKIHWWNERPGKYKRFAAKLYLMEVGNQSKWPRSTEIPLCVWWDETWKKRNNTAKQTDHRSAGPLGLENAFASPPLIPREPVGLRW